MAIAFGPLDELIGTLLETWNNRYVFECDRERRSAVFTRDGIQVRVDELKSGKLRVFRESASDESVEKMCDVQEAAELIEATLFPQQGNTKKVAVTRPWWKRLFGP